MAQPDKPAPAMIATATVIRRVLEVFIVVFFCRLGGVCQPLFLQARFAVRTLAPLAPDGRLMGKLCGLPYIPSLQREADTAQMNVSADMNAESLATLSHEL